MQRFSLLVINKYPQFANIVYEHFLNMYYRLCLGQTGRAIARAIGPLKLDWVYEKISKQNSNALRYCGFDWFELSLRTVRQNKWR